MLLFILVVSLKLYGCILIYTLVSICIILMSQHRNHAQFMDIVLSKRSFDVVISDAIVLGSPGKIMRLPPATSFFWRGSSFCSL